MILIVIGALIFMALILKGSSRTANDILAAVKRIDPEHNPSLQPGAPPAPPGGTWCNKFIAWVTSELGAPVPFGEYGTPVNAQIAWLENQNDGWHVATESEAQLSALAGKVALATYFNTTGGHGHIALVLPYSGAMRVAQAGASNFNDRPLASGFGTLPVVFFVHED